MQIPITILPNDDGSFTAISTIFSFVTEGETLEEVLKNAQEAAQCHLEGLQKLAKTDVDEAEFLRGVQRGLNTFVVA